MKSTHLFSTLALATSFAAGAHATTFTFDWKAGDRGNVMNDAGKLMSVKSSFDTKTEVLKYQFTVAAEKNDPKNEINGFYLALNNGPDPSGRSGEMAVLYFDATKSGSPILTTYAYNGTSAKKSWEDGDNASGNQSPDKILSSIKDKSWVNSTIFRTNADGSRTLGFDIDATKLNLHKPKYPTSGATWDGLEFGNKVGIWFAGFEDGRFSYGNDGFISSLSFGDRSGLDANNLQAVPEPATMSLLALAAAIRRRKQSKAK
jgi:hypothetical protein